MAEESTEVAIIGAGPAGLFTAFQCGMLRLGCTLFDTLDAVGGQCTALYPEKPIFDIPAYPRIAAGDLIARLEEQVAPFEPGRRLGEEVLHVAGDAANGFELATDKGGRVHAGAVIVAGGAGAFGPNRPPLDGIEAFEGTSVFYYVTRKEDFRDKRVVIAGGGDSAVDWALELVDVAAHVMVVHRRDRFRAQPDNVARLRALAEEGRIELVIPYNLAALDGNNGRLAAVRVQTLDGDERDLPADVLLPFFGLAMDLGPIKHWDLAMDQYHVAVDPGTCATSRPGVFAVGDVVSYPGKLKLITTGFAEAAQAAHAAFHVCRPNEVLHFEHSTSRGVPGKTS